MLQAVSHRAFEPGTTGWTVDDLDDPEILWQWTEGRFELVDGVLTKMAPQGFEGIDPLDNLRRLVERQLNATGQRGNFYRESDLLLRRGRIARPDMVYLTAEQRRQQKLKVAQKSLGRRKSNPIYVMPYLIVESVSASHEDHDRVTKFDWYAAAGIPNYWILTWFERSLTCYMLDGNRYVQESAGTNEEIVQTEAFGGVSIPLAQVWDDV